MPCGLHLGAVRDREIDKRAHHTCAAVGALEGGRGGGLGELLGFELHGTHAHDEADQPEVAIDILPGVVGGEQRDVHYYSEIEDREKGAEVIRQESERRGELEKNRREKMAEVLIRLDHHHS